MNNILKETREINDIKNLDREDILKNIINSKYTKEIETFGFREMFDNFTFSFEVLIELYNENQFKKVETFLKENYKQINTNTLLISQSIIEKIGDKSLNEILTLELKTRIERSSSLNKYMMDLCFVFCCKHNINILELNLFENSDNYYTDNEIIYSEGEIEKVLRKKRDTTSYKDDKYIYQIYENLDFLNSENKIHLNNFIFYIDNKIYSSSKNNETMNTINVYKKLKIDKLDLNLIFQDIEKIPYVKKNTSYEYLLCNILIDSTISYENQTEEYYFNNVIPNISIIQNKAMTLNSKLIFLEKTLNQFDTMKKIDLITTFKLELLHILDLMRKEKKEIFDLNQDKYKNIIEFSILSILFSERNGFQYDSYSKYNSVNVGMGMEMEKLINKYDSNKTKYLLTEVLYELYLPNEVHKVSKIIQVLIETNSIKSLFLNLIDTSILSKTKKKKILKMLKIDENDYLYKKELHFFSELSVIFLEEKIKKEKQKVFQNSYFVSVIKKKSCSKLIKKSKLIKEFIKDNYSTFLNIWRDENYINFLYNEKLIGKNQYEDMLFENIINRNYKDKEFEEFEKISDRLKSVEGELSVLEIFKIRYTNYLNESNDLYKNTYIFEYMKLNLLKILSSESILKILTEEDKWHNEINEEHQVLFIKDLIEYFKDVEMWNLIKELATVDYSIDINESLKKEFYYTFDDMDELFEI